MVLGKSLSLSSLAPEFRPDPKGIEATREVLRNFREELYSDRASVIVWDPDKVNYPSQGREPEQQNKTWRDVLLMSPKKRTAADNEILCQSLKKENIDFFDDMSDKLILHICTQAVVQSYPEVGCSKTNSPCLLPVL